MIQGRGELAAAIGNFFADSRRLTATLSSVIEAAGHGFRFRDRVAYPDGRTYIELFDVGEIDADGRISALYTFVEPLAARDDDAPAHDGPAAPTALAVRRYVELWSERDRAAGLMDSGSVHRRFGMISSTCIGQWTSRHCPQPCACT